MNTEVLRSWLIWNICRLRKRGPWRILEIGDGSQGPKLRIPALMHHRLESWCHAKQQVAKAVLGRESNWKSGNLRAVHVRRANKGG